MSDELANEDDFTHYFNATGRLSRRVGELESRNARLRMALAGTLHVLNSICGNKPDPMWQHVLDAATESLSEGSTVQGNDKLETNSEPHGNHSQPHSGTIEPRLSVTPKVVPVLLPFRIATLDVDPEADARIDALVAAQPKQQLTPRGNLLRQDEVRMVHDAARASALEEAAKLLEGTDGWPSPQGKSIAAAIRAIKENHAIAAIRALGAKP